MQEIRKRIENLQEMRQTIVNSPQIANDWEAAVCFLDMAIADHKSDLMAYAEIKMTA